LLKEVLIGTSIAFLVFLAAAGYDIVPLLLLAGVAMMFFIVADKKGLGQGRRFEDYSAKTTIGFDQIGGQQAAKQELTEALDFIINPQKVEELGIRPLKGIILLGPPGTGKTLLAKAAANYTDAVFLAASGSEFVEMYAGVGAQRVRKLFQQAREMAVKGKKDRAILFVDEIEVLGGKRGSHGSHLEYDQTLNQLLVEMDGLKANDDVRVLLIAATNRADMLDEALMRPGRFDRQVKVPLPDKDGRKEILKIHCTNKPIVTDVDLDQVAKDSYGFSGAHLESVVNEAAIMAFRNNMQAIIPEHFREAIDKVMLGEKLDRKPTSEEVERIAVHETGHALISEILRPNSVSHLTITSRGNALGYMRQTPQDDQYLYTRKQLVDQIKVCVAGAEAEKLILNGSSTGAGNDYQQAVNLVYKIISVGLSSLGIVDMENADKGSITSEMNSILNEQNHAVKEMLNQYHRPLVAISRRLMTDEHISGQQLRQYLQADQANASI